MEITLEEIQKKFDSLPEDLKWAIMGANVDDNIIEISQTQGLNVEQMGQLSLETHMVMFGFTHPDKFEESLKGSMKLGDEKTHIIANAVNEKILKEIRGKMMQMYEGTPKESEKQEALPQNPEEDNNVLNSHGIEIIPEKLELTTSEKDVAKIHTILEQKLSGSFKNTTVRTEHALENITKSPGTPGAASQVPIPPSSVMGSIKPASMETMKTSPSYGRGADPYRLPPED